MRRQKGSSAVLTGGNEEKDDKAEEVENRWNEK